MPFQWTCAMRPQPSSASRSFGAIYTQAGRPRNRRTVGALALYILLDYDNEPPPVGRKYVRIVL
jgi:hypothetical protein